MNPQITNGGAFISPQIGVTPRAPTSSGTAIKGDAIDRLGFGSCVLVLQTGADSGTPDSFSIAAKLQESDTTTDGDFTDITGAAVTAVTTEGAVAKDNIDLTSCKRYIREVITPTYVGGTSPYVFLSGQVILTGPSNPPTT